jgi:hypothetical protein
LARQVCVHLREQHKMRAYIYNRGDEERKRQEEEWQRLKQANPNVPIRRKTVRIVDHYAVLIAGWPDFKPASEFLPTVKNYPLPELKLEGGSPYEIMSYREVDPQTKQVVVKHAKVNPFHSAMVTRNPLVASAAANRPKFDPFWVKLNEDEKYSLLKSRGKYTLLIKEYTGSREIQQSSHQQSSHRGGSFLDALLGNSRPGDALDAAAAQAHELAKFLRHKDLGFKAFVLHMRGASVVTVGEFSSLDDPDLQRVQRRLAALRIQTERTGGTDPIGLMPNPVAIEVPRPDNGKQ